MPDRANPNTCLHRVIEAFVTFGGGVEYSCSSCDSYLDPSFFDGRLWKYRPEFERWEQVGPTGRLSLKEQAERRHALNGDRRVERAQAPGSSGD